MLFRREQKLFNQFIELGLQNVFLLLACGTCYQLAFYALNTET